MKLKLDENLGIAVKAVFERHGYDAATVREEGLQGSTDENLLDIATREGRILVTLDRGFGDWRVYLPGSHAGIVLLRPSVQVADVITELCERMIDQIPAERLSGAVTIVSPRTIRIFPAARRSEG